MEKPPAPGSTSASAVGHCLVADHSFDLIMQNLKGFYAPRKGHKMEAKGNRYQHDHYVVKIASVTYGASNRGILVEVEDSRTSVIADTWDPLAKFVQVLLQQQHPHSPPNKASGETEYTPTDRALLYIQIFSKLRKGTR
jgi:mediator of RNA polymerase II transcription subunit 20